MKTRSILLMLTLVLVAVPALAQNSLFQVKVGLYNPDATDTGFMFTGAVGTEIDQRVDVTLTGDFYRKTFEDVERIRVEQDGADLIEVRPNFESSVTMLPLMGHVRLKFPLGDKVQYPILPYIQGGAGYVLAWHAWDDADTGESDTNFYHGFGLQFALGAMYPIGEASRVNLELYYQVSSLEREEDTELGLVRTELDMSGIGIRLGLQFGGGSIN